MNYSEVIEKNLKEHLRPSFIRVEDQSHLHAGHAEARRSGGGHYAITIIAACFEGKTHLQRHRMIYNALGGEFSKNIHALAIEAKTEEEGKKSGT